MEERFKKTPSPTSLTTDGVPDYPCPTGETVSFKTVHPHGESDSSTDVNKGKNVVFMENLDCSLSFKEIFDVMKAFGPIDRVQGLNLIKTNSFYVRFTDYNNAAAACKTIHNMKLCEKYVSCRLYSNRNFQEQDDDFIPEEDITDLSETSNERSECDTLRPIYNLVIAEEGHETMKVFDSINNLINKPKLTPSTFKKFGKNLI